MLKILFTILSLFCVTIGLAQSDTIATDRPGQSYSTATIPKGKLQVEAGAFMNVIGEDNEFDWGTGAILRYGLLKRFETSLDYAFLADEADYEEIESLDDLVPNFSQLRIGVRYEILKETQFVPALAGGLFYHIPIQEIETQNSLPQILLTASKGFNNFGINPSFLIFYRDYQKAPELLTTLNISYSATSVLGVFVGTAIRQTGIEDSEANTFLEGGFTYLVKSNFQIDADFGTARLNFGLDSLYGSVGFGFLF